MSTTNLTLLIKISDQWSSQENYSCKCCCWLYHLWDNRERCVATYHQQSERNTQRGRSYLLVVIFWPLFVKLRALPKTVHVQQEFTARNHLTSMKTFSFILTPKCSFLQSTTKFFLFLKNWNKECRWCKKSYSYKLPSTL